MTRHRIRPTPQQNPGERLRRAAAAARLSVAVCDLPDRPWTAGDVADVLRARPDWLKDARRRQSAAKAEQDEQQQAPLAAVEARRAGFTYPAVPAAAAEFAREFTSARLLNHLRRALDATAADTYLVDSGYDVSTHASQAAKKRTRSGRRAGLPCPDSGTRTSPTTGRTGSQERSATCTTHRRAARATYVSEAGFTAETWADAWQGRVDP